MYNNNQKKRNIYHSRVIFDDRFCAFNNIQLSIIFLIKIRNIYSKKKGKKKKKQYLVIKGA